MEGCHEKQEHGRSGKHLLDDCSYCQNYIVKQRQFGREDSPIIAVRVASGNEESPSLGSISALRKNRGCQGGGGTSQDDRQEDTRRHRHFDRMYLGFALVSLQK